MNIEFRHIDDDARGKLWKASDGDLFVYVLSVIGLGVAIGNLNDFITIECGAFALVESVVQSGGFGLFIVECANLAIAVGFVGAVVLASKATKDWLIRSLKSQTAQVRAQGNDL
jgi:hypothetical protein